MTQPELSEHYVGNFQNPHIAVWLLAPRLSIRRIDTRLDLRCRKLCSTAQSTQKLSFCYRYYYVTPLRCSDKRPSQFRLFFSRLSYACSCIFCYVLDKYEFCFTSLWLRLAHSFLCGVFFVIVCIGDWNKHRNYRFLQGKVVS